MSDWKSRLQCHLKFRTSTFQLLFDEEIGCGFLSLHEITALESSEVAELCALLKLNLGERKRLQFYLQNPSDPEEEPEESGCALLRQEECVVLEEHSHESKEDRELSSHSQPVHADTGLKASLGYSDDYFKVGQVYAYVFDQTWRIGKVYSTQDVNNRTLLRFLQFSRKNQFYSLPSSPVPFTMKLERVFYGPVVLTYDGRLSQQDFYAINNAFDALDKPVFIDQNTKMCPLERKCNKYGDCGLRHSDDDKEYFESYKVWPCENEDRCEVVYCIYAHSEAEARCQTCRAIGHFTINCPRTSARQPAQAASNFSGNPWHNPFASLGEMVPKAKTNNTNAKTRKTKPNHK